MCETIQKRRSHLSISEDLGPFREAEVGCSGADQRALVLQNTARVSRVAQAVLGPAFLGSSPVGGEIVS